MQAAAQRCCVCAAAKQLLPWVLRRAGRLCAPACVAPLLLGQRCKVRSLHLENQESCDSKELMNEHFCV
jgi:hypothetical protein